MLLFGVRKNICTASFLDIQEPHSWSTLKENIFIFLSPYETFCSRDVVRFYLIGVGLGGVWIISLTLSWQRPLSYRNQSIDLFCKITAPVMKELRRLTFCASQNVLQFVILIEIFENSTISQHLDTSIYNMKTLKFSRQFELQG